MLFQGPTGVGKTSLAFLVAAAIQCRNVDEQGNACGTCPTCIDIFEEKFTRGCTHMLDGSSSSKDDVISRIAETIHTTPLHGPKHVFIVEEVDQLSTQAKNAFHKFLEKPSPYVHFILLSMSEANGNKVPPSIMDRCQPYHFKPISEKDIAYTLKGILEKEGLWDTLPAEFKKEGLFLLINNAGGSLRRAVQFVERAMIGELYTVEEIEENYKFMSETSSLGLLKSLVMGEKQNFLDQLEKLRRNNQLVDWMHAAAYFVLRYQQTKLIEGFDTTPSTQLLIKAGDKIDVDLLCKMVVDMQRRIHTSTYFTATEASLEIMEMYKKMHTKAIPFR